MASYNRVIVAGNLTRDPELKFAQSGTAIAALSLAVNDRRKNPAGEWVDEVSFVDVTFFGRTAEVCGEYCTKGSNILVEGKLKQETWEKDGQRHSKIKIIGDQMQMLGTKGAKADAPPRETAAPAPSRAANARPAHESVPADDIPF